MDVNPAMTGQQLRTKLAAIVGNSAAQRRIFLFALMPIVRCQEACPPRLCPAGCQDHCGITLGPVHLVCIAPQVGLVVWS